MAVGALVSEMDHVLRGIQRRKGIVVHHHCDFLCRRDGRQCHVPYTTSSLVHCHVDFDWNLLSPLLPGEGEGEGLFPASGDPHPSPLPEGEGAKATGTENRQIPVDV